jgi:hypothetical protein
MMKCPRWVELLTPVDGKGFMQIAVIINAQLLFAGADFDPGAALLRIKAIAR